MTPHDPAPPRRGSERRGASDSSKDHRRSIGAAGLARVGTSGEIKIGPRRPSKLLATTRPERSEAKRPHLPSDPTETLQGIHHDTPYGRQKPLLRSRTVHGTEINPQSTRGCLGAGLRIRYPLVGPFWTPQARETLPG
ncbi:hypothetical protein THAOC_24312, partial [Thalassiosira oceanica]